MIPSSGAEYVYLLVGLGPLPAFVFSWVCSFVLKPSMLAIICLSFAEYLVEAFVEECEPPSQVVTLVGVLTIGECREDGDGDGGQGRGGAVLRS